MTPGAAGHPTAVRNWRTIRDHLLAVGRPGREREVVVQAAKAALAAVLALPATEWAQSPQSFLAPYAAALAVTSTVRGSWTGAARQAGIVVTGVLLAFVVAVMISSTLLALPLAVLVGLLIGRWHRFGSEGYWVAITALILLVNGTAEQPPNLASWAVLSLTGSLVGALVNTLLLPPVHLRDAHDAVRTLTTEVAAQLREMAGQVRADWAAQDAERWARSARGLRGAVRRADDAVWHGRESVCWNPRRRLIRRSDSPLAGAGVVDRLSRVSERVLQAGVLLTDLADNGERPAAPALADAMDRLADGVEAMAERPDELSEALTGPAEQARRLRAEAATGPGAVRGACLITVSDALAELTG
jgi:hypothetical protein